MATFFYSTLIFLLLGTIGCQSGSNDQQQESANQLKSEIITLDSINQHLEMEAEKLDQQAAEVDEAIDNLLQEFGE